MDSDPLAGPHLSDLSDEELIVRLETKYQRPAPGPCPVCGGPLSVHHRGGGLPLTWACDVAADVIAASPSQSPEVCTATDHLSRSVHLDYRAVGDARVIELIRRFRLRAPLSPRQDQHTSSQQPLPLRTPLLGEHLATS